MTFRSSISENVTIESLDRPRPHRQMVGTQWFYKHDSQNGSPGRRRLGLYHARPDGLNYPNKITYIEVKKPERLVYKHGDEGQPAFFLVTVIFEDLGKKTELSIQDAVHGPSRH